MRTIAEVRYHGTAMFLGMAFWIEDQTVFESASADKAQYYNGFLDTQGSQTERLGERAARAPAHRSCQCPAVSTSGHARSSSSVVMQRHSAI